MPGHIRGGPAVDATAAYAVNDTKNANRFRLSKLDLKTGKALWSVEDEDLGSHDSAPLLTGAQVVLTSRNSSIAGYDVASGRPAFQQALPNPADLSKIRLASAGGMLLLHSVGLPPADSAMLYAIDLAGRQVLWSHAVGRPDKYDPTGKWPTKYFLPVDNGLYYENQQLIVKLTAQ